MLPRPISSPTRPAPPSSTRGKTAARSCGTRPAPKEPKWPTTRDPACRSAFSRIASTAAASAEAAMVHGTGSQTAGRQRGATRLRRVSQEGMETKIRPAARAASPAITRCTAPRTLCRNGWPQTQGKATSWNITQGRKRRRRHSHQQNGRFIAFMPYMCGTYWTSRWKPGRRRTGRRPTPPERRPKRPGRRWTRTPALSSAAAGPAGAQTCTSSPAPASPPPAGAYSR